MEDRLYVEGTILTPTQRAEALLVEGGIVVAVGDLNGVRRQKATGTPVVRLASRLIVPGLIDAHMHFADSIWAAQGVTLYRAESLESLGRRLRHWVVANPQGPVVGGGWDEGRLAEGRAPTRSDIDRFSPDRPTLLYRTCTHVAVLNSVALESLGISKRTPDPPGGSLGRGPKREPDGLLYENAERLARPLVEQFVLQRKKGLPRFWKSVAARGVTTAGVMSAEPFETRWARETASKGILDVRLRLYPRIEHIDDSARIDQEDPEADVSVAGTKVVLDGALGPRTAWLREAYSDRPDGRGYPLWSTRRLGEELARPEVESGPVAFHAIGDAALDLALRIMVARPTPSRDRIEHASLVLPDLGGKFARLRPCVVVQPQFLTSDTWIMHRLGPGRAAHAYPFQSLRLRGLQLAGSSDAPVEKLDPFEAMKAAIRRVPRTPFGRLTSKERLSPPEALAMFTTGAARAVQTPSLGRLEPGAPADYTVLSLTRLEQLAWPPRSPVVETWKGGSATFPASSPSRT